MAMDRNGFIDGLVASHGRRPPLPRPGRRCWRWFLGAAVVTGALLGLIQPYRPGCLHQLCICPRLLVETLAALLLSALGVYMLFVKSVPGERLSSAVRLAPLRWGSCWRAAWSSTP